MQRERLSLDVVTSISIVKSCGILSTMHKIQDSHANIVKMNKEHDVFIRNVVVNMYAWFGLLIQAYKSLDTLRVSNLVSWISFIVGYANQGLRK